MLVVGANLGTATAGAVEWDGHAVRKTLAFLDSNITGTAADVSGTVAIANGGTGATTASAALTALDAAACGANADITSLSVLTTASVGRERHAVSGRAAAALPPRAAATARRTRSVPYFFFAWVGRAGRSCSAVKADRATAAFGLSCLGFFCSRLLRF